MCPANRVQVKELHKIIDATNFYISLLDEKENKLYFPYYRDEMDIFPLEGKDATGIISTYMIKNRKSLLLGSKQVKEMGSQGKIDILKTGVFSDKSHWLGVPLKVEDKAIGTMVVQSYTNPNLYDKKDLKLMEFVSEQVATAIERKRTEEALQASQQEFSNLFNGSPEAAIYHDEKGTILNINPRFTELFGYALAEIKGKNINDGMIFPEAKTIKESEKLTRLALEGKVVTFETIRKKKNNSLISVIISVALVITEGQHKHRGVIAFYKDITERKQNEKMQQVLYNISKAANSLISLGQLYPVIHKELGKIINTTNFYIALVDEKEGKAFFPYHVDEKEDDFNPQELKSNKSLTCYVIKNGSSFLLNFNTIKELIKYKKLTNPGVITEKISWLGVPLKVEDKVIGAMAVQSYTNPKLYSEKDVGLLEFVSEQVATAIERKRMEEELKKLAHRDPLTGTYNKGYGLELLQRQVKLAKRNKTSFLLAYTDLDNLKKINDEFGHKEGDKVITKVANLFQSILREVDIVIRMGGDEFLLVFPGSSVKEIPIIEKRLYDKLSRKNRVSNESYKIGFSIGFSCYDPEHPKSIEELMHISDQKMYKSKKR